MFAISTSRISIVVRCVFFYHCTHFCIPPTSQRLIRLPWQPRDDQSWALATNGSYLWCERSPRGEVIQRGFRDHLQVLSREPRRAVISLTKPTIQYSTHCPSPAHSQLRHTSVICQLDSNYCLPYSCAGVGPINLLVIAFTLIYWWQ